MADESPTQEFFTVKQVAAKFNVSTVWIYKLIDEGAIEASKPFGTKTWRIHKREIDRMAKQQEKAPGESLRARELRDVDVKKIVVDDKTRKYLQAGGASPASPTLAEGAPVESAVNPSAPVPARPPDPTPERKAVDDNPKPQRRPFIEFDLRRW